VEGNWQIINEAIRTALERITLHQMARPLPDRLVQLGAHRPRPTIEPTDELLDAATP
jgi:hypothetical protein